MLLADVLLRDAVSEDTGSTPSRGSPTLAPAHIALQRPDTFVILTALYHCE
jgi:hypothetical protein